MEINEIEILSVGVDVGSSTSHLAFSNLVLKRDERSASRRFQIQERNIIYEGRIINTPFLDNKTIDIDKLTDFLIWQWVQVQQPDQRITIKQYYLVILVGEHLTLPYQKMGRLYLQVLYL